MAATHERTDPPQVASAGAPSTSPRDTPAAAARAIPTKLIFFVALLIVLLVYTQLAFQMEWTTKAGRIGAGFFPQIIGVLGTLLTAWALLQAWRDPSDASDGFEEEDQGEADLGKHPLVMTGVVLGAVVLLLTFVSLGAIVAGAVFTFAVLAYLNRGNWLANAILAIGVPLGLYLLFQTALNAGLPSGILPRF